MDIALRPGLTFCRVEDRFVFLDLPADRYFCLGKEAAGAFSSVLAGNEDCEADTARNALVSSGLLISNADAAPPRACTGPVILGSLQRSAPESIGPGQIARAIVGRFQAQATLCMFGLDHTLADLARRKGRAMLSPDHAAASKAGAAFAGAALLHERTSRCLSISVATMRWLLARRCAANLVIGVKLHPFQAHCWVETDGQLVNDEVDGVRPFVPILVV